MDNIELETIKLLKELGIRPHFKGYAFIKTGVALLLKDHNLLYAVTKKLYPAIAEEFNTEPSRVEHGIRHAVEMSECDISVRLRLLGSVDHISNSQFMATIVEEIRVRMSLGRN